MYEDLFFLNSSPIYELPQFLVKALLYLPGNKQKAIVDKYGELLYSVRQADYDRGIKIFSKSEGLLALNDDDLFEALDDILTCTKVS